jgi:hypothetical protein
LSAHETVESLKKAFVVLLLAFLSLAHGQQFSYLYDPSGHLVSVAPGNPVSPTIASQPSPQLVETNGQVTFSIVASGPGISYQWLSNGIAIAGATNDSLILGSSADAFWVENGNATITNNLLTLTDGGMSEARSAFFDLPQPITNFTVSFTYQATDGASADGIAFVLQDSSAGAIALGGLGGGLGYSGITPSAAVEFNLYTGSPGATGIAFATNGLTAINGGAPYATPGLVNLASQHPINVNLAYSAGTLALTLTDAVAGVSFATNFTVNLPGILGGPTAYVGFTGGTGVYVARQQITNFAFQGGANASPLSFSSLNYSVLVSNAFGSVTSSPVSLWTDSNGNGIPDWWEWAYFGDLNQPADGDFDGDGVSNIDEYREGTNPTNAASYDPRLYIQSIRGRVVVTPDLPYYIMGQEVALTALPDAGEVFLGWSGGAGGTNTSISLLMNSNQTVTATFGLSLPVALDDTNLVWTTGGNAPWFGQAQISEDGIGAAQSGLITDNQQSWLQAVTNLSQPMQLAFWWNVSSQPPNGLTFAMDGTVLASNSGTGAGWQFVQTNLSTGNHTLLWTYSKSVSDTPTGVPFADSGWVDEVSLVPVAELPVFTTQPLSQFATNGDNVTLNAVAGGPGPISFQWLFNNSPLPGATNTNLVLTSVQRANTGSYQLVAANPFGAIRSAVATLTVLVPPCPGVPQGIIAWWKGENNALDVVGGNNGTLVNAVTFAPGIVGTAFSFDGISAYVEITNSAAFNFGRTSPMSVELWAYRTGTAGVMQIIGKRDGCASSGIHYQMAFDGNGLVFGGDSGLVRSGSQLPLNIWTHLAATFDGSTFRFYTNGVLAGTGTGMLGPPATTPLRIGTAGTCSTFAGLLDEVSIYQTALSSNEVAAIYLAGSGGKCAIPTVPIAFDTSPSVTGWTTNGFQMQLSGLTGQGPVIIYISTNLLLWTPIYTNPPAIGSIQFVDSTATNLPVRFYRAATQY